MKPPILKPKHEFLTHSWNVFDVCFSPDSKIMAAGTLEKKGVSLIATRTWKLLRMLPEPNFPPNTMEFSPDAKDFVMTFGQEEPMRCWCVATGHQKWELPKTGKHAVYSPDGKWIATTKSKSMLLLEAASGKLVHQFDGHSSPVTWTFFSSTGDRVASLAKSQLWLWDVARRKSVRLVQEKKGEITKAAFSGSGALLAAVSMDGGVRLYDGQTGVFVREMEGHEDMVWDVAFTADEKLLVTAGFDQKVRIWDVTSGKELRSIQVHEDIMLGRFELSPDSRMIAVPMEHPICAVQVFSVANAELLAELSTQGEKEGKGTDSFQASPEESLAFSPDGKWLAATCSDDKTRVWSLKGIKA